MWKLHFTVPFSGKDCSTEAVALSLKSYSSLIFTSLSNCVRLSSYK